MLISKLLLMKNNWIIIGSKFLIIAVFFSLLTQSCLNLRSCKEDLEGKYFCYNDKTAINYLIIRKDGTFYHYYNNGEIELHDNGTWKKNDDGYCKIELSQWKNFNEKGTDYEDFMSGLLFINGSYLDIGPDGESSTSFIKE